MKKTHTEVCKNSTYALFVNMLIILYIHILSKDQNLKSKNINNVYFTNISQNVASSFQQHSYYNVLGLFYVL